MNNNPNGNASGQGPPPQSGGPSMQINNQNMVNPNSQGASNPANSGGIIPNTGSSWAQAAGKSLQASGGGGVVGALGGGNVGTNPNQPPSVGSNGGSGSSSGGAPNPASSVTSKQIEQLNSMREALFSHDGWGGVSPL
jgi:hypothetical protein